MLFGILVRPEQALRTIRPGNLAELDTYCAFCSIPLPLFCYWFFHYPVIGYFDHPF